MSGIEVVAAVAGIVSAYTGATALFQKWRRKRKAKKESKSEEVDTSLSKGGPLVQRHYDEGFAKIGKAFAKGDGMSSARIQS